MIINEDHIRNTLITKYKNQIDYLTKKFNALIEEKYLSDTSDYCRIDIHVNPTINRQIALLFRSLVEKEKWVVSQFSLQNGYLSLTLRI